MSRLLPQIRPDLMGSLGLHLGLILLLTFWTPMMPERVLTDSALPIDIITLDEFTRLLASPKPPEIVKSRPAPTPVPAQAAPEVAPPPPKAQNQDAMPELTARPAQPEPKPAKPTPPPMADFKVTSASPVARPNLPPAKPKPLLDIGQLRALLDKTPDAVATDSPDVPREEAPTGEKLTVNEIDAFRAQMRRCWSPPSGARGAENLIINVRLSLSPEGAILAGPVVVNRGQLGDPFFRAAAESVLRAIRRCQPFTMPVEKYASWRDIELTFDPSRMLGN